MSLIGSIGQFQPTFLSRLPGLGRPEGPAAPTKLPDGLEGAGKTSGTQPTNFGSVFEQLVGAVDEKQDAAAAVTKDVLLGKNDQLHQSVIAMQEASVAFSLMVEVRNKLVDSYQELMRMPV